MKAYENLK